MCGTVAYTQLFEVFMRILGTHSRWGNWSSTITIRMTCGLLEQSLKYMLEQCIFIPMQQKWSSKLIGSDFKIYFRSGKEDKVEQLKQEWQEDVEIQKLIQEMQPNPTSHSKFSWEHELKGGHSGVKKTLRNKHENVSYPGLLQPLPILEQVWMDISMDFIEGLHKSHGKHVIFVVVDRLSKYAHFMPMSHPYTALDVAQSFMDNIYKLHGPPKRSIAYHPQTDSQIEVVNKCLEEYLRCITGDRPKEWTKWLPLVEWWLPKNRNYQLSKKVHPIFHVSCLKKKIGKSITPYIELPVTREDGQLQLEPISVLDKSGQMEQSSGDTMAGSMVKFLSTGSTITDQMDLLREQMKMLAGEVALCTSSLKRLSEQAASNPEDSQLKEHMQKLKDEISEKKLQMRVLEQRMIGSVEMTPHTNTIEMSQALSKLTTQLNEKTFELEITSADNRILQEQLQMKMSENAEMQETILLLRQQLNSLLDKSSSSPQQIPDNGASTLKKFSKELFEKKSEGKEDTYIDENTPTSVMSLNRVFSQEDSKECNGDTFLSSQVLMQASEIENLKQEKVRLIEEKDGLEIHSRKLAEEASYAKELAAAAAVELRNLAEEVTKLSYQNAKLSGDLASAKEAPCRSNCCQRPGSFDVRQSNSNGARLDARLRKPGDGMLVEELQKELNARYQRESSLETALFERDQIEGELRGRLDEAKQREEDLENELANMWMLVAKMRKSGTTSEETSSEGVHESNILQSRVEKWISTN
ncbi:Kinesin-like protein KIN-7E, chloroplastic [Vitis vinifera]|uniref:Kinesin-like protein KIN-7E, chloroplastic n=1 Tax=Vitis vinifera TaxID=29760 RepID=A0A438KN82_VITVI|nr:Kinesin-like protein KIN-7E, chloroplastic [Vitis vinifera]